jgi:hypothetical protein
MRPRASTASLILGLRLERLLEVFCIGACFSPLLPGHLRSLRSVHVYELRFRWASTESISASPQLQLAGFLRIDEKEF